ncbi:hypothetical protein ACIBBE_42885 [Streptomyces sp. NPDC051644]|uniref:hypothetical protein n=1 Tax=Streptomyces sp. NPDC051644 TaxID=3365666 RepID=UPI0037B64D12
MGTGSGPLWQWPLHSTRRLIATATVLVTAVVGVSMAVNTSDGGRPSAAPGPAPSPSASWTQPSASPSITPSSPRPSASDFDEAMETARSFVAAWANHKAPNRKAWYAGAALYATDGFAMQLTSVDYHNVPATQISGGLRLTDTGGSGRTEVAVPTDAGLMSVVLVDGGQRGWQVDDIQPGAQVVE